MNELLQAVWFIGTGIIFTLKLLWGGLIVGCAGGIFLAILRYNAVGVWAIKFFISLVRGTPLILQLSVVYFLTPGLIGLRLSILTVGIMTFGLNASAYIAEILRSGIDHVPQGQFEAAKALHIPVWYSWKDIILPQVMRNILPAFISEIIVLLKETALIATIGGSDIMRKAQIVAAEHFTYFMPLCIAAIYYYILVLLIEYIGRKIERKGRYDNHR